MSSKPDGGAAFPFASGIQGAPLILGMSLRQWYAGQALAGFAAGSISCPPLPGDPLETIACMSRNAADALIAELNKDAEATDGDG